jgi:hypothetical protein
VRKYLQKCKEKKKQEQVMEQEEEEAVELASATGRTSVSRSLNCTHVQLVLAPLNKFFQNMALFGAMFRTGFDREGQKAC